MKEYSEISNYLKMNRINKDGIKTTLMYKKLVKLGYIIDENIFIKNIESMSNKYDPNRIRIRSDKFIKLASDGKEAFLLAGIRINYKNLILCFSTKSFLNYNFSTKSSNSFINFDFNKLISLTKEYNNNSTQTYFKKNDEIIFFYSYFNKLDVLSFENFLSNINNIDSNVLYNSILDNSNYDKYLSTEQKNVIQIKYNNKCAIRDCSNGCLLEINWEKTLENIKNKNLSLPLEFHHFLPKKYFKLKSKVEHSDTLLDWEIINNEINIIPLCDLCHKSIHNSNKDIVKNKFYEIINTYKSKNIFENFEEYLQNNSELDLDELLNFYLGNKNSSGNLYE